MRAVSYCQTSRYWEGILRGACLLALLLPVSALAAETLTNGSFESGNLSGWTPDTPLGSIIVVGSHSGYESYAPKHGSQFALLRAPGGSSDFVRLYRTVHLDAGDTLSGWAFFDVGAYINPLSQGVVAGVSVADPSGREQAPFGSNESTPWREWKFTASVTGDYTITAYVKNGGTFTTQDDYLGLDGITVTALPDTKAPVVTPPQDIRVEIPAREKTAPATHADIAAFLNAATASDDRDGALAAKAVNPPAGFPVGETVVTFEAVDTAGNRGSATARVTVVQAPNRPPVAVDDSAATRIGATATLNVATNDSDPDGDPLTTELVKPPAHGRAELGRDGTLRYTPESGFTGDDLLTYAVLDGQGGRAEATGRITVADSPVEAEAPKPAGTPPAQPSPPPTEPVPPATPTATVVKAPDGSVTWTFRGEIVETEVDYHTLPANKDWLYVFEIGDGNAPAQWIRVEHPTHKYAPSEDASFAKKTRRRFAWVPRETKDYRVQVWAEKGAYVLTVTGRADDHGNDWQHATPVSLGQAVPGEIWEVPGNVDVFSFQGKKGGIYRIETQQPENPKAHLRVYDRKPGGAAREDFTWAGKPSRSVTFRTPRDDTYYVQVWGGVGKYTLRIMRLK